MFDDEYVARMQSHAAEGERVDHQVGDGIARHNFADAPDWDGLNSAGGGNFGRHGHQPAASHAAVFGPAYPHARSRRWA